MKNWIDSAEASSSSSAAYDANALNGLRRAAQKNDPEALAKVAKQFEGLFVNMMLKSMRAALPQDGMLNNDQTRMYTSMYDQQLSQDLSSKGLGLADMIVKQATQRNTPPPGADVGTTAMPLGPERLTANSLPLALVGEFLRREQQNGGFGQRNTQLPQSSEEFADRLSVPSMLASMQSGIPHQLIMAQAALESGWGRREITTADGKPSHNIFGVKASEDWDGKVTEIMTTEYQNGQPYKVKERFRVYDSYLDALNDYVSLLTKNARYKAVVQANTPEEGAYALQRAGYATDPQYGNKLVQIIGQIKQSAQQAVKAYTHDLSKLF